MCRSHGWQVEIRRGPREHWRPGKAGPFYVVLGSSPEAAYQEVAHIRWLIVATALEGIVSAGGRARQEFLQRTVAMGDEVGAAITKGQAVKIKEGPFDEFEGVVDEVQADRGTVRVIVTIFGRATPVELQYWQVEKA